MAMLVITRWYIPLMPEHPLRVCEKNLIEPIANLQQTKGPSKSILNPDKADRSLTRGCKLQNSHPRIGGTFLSGTPGRGIFFGHSCTTKSHQFTIKLPCKSPYIHQ